MLQLGYLCQDILPGFVYNSRKALMVPTAGISLQKQMLKHSQHINGWQALIQAGGGVGEGQGVAQEPNQVPLCGFVQMCIQVFSFYNFKQIFNQAVNNLWSANYMEFNSHVYNEGFFGTQSCSSVQGRFVTKTFRWLTKPKHLSPGLTESICQPLL